ncbi:hypothetical protein [Neobacillus sp. PS2-9]|uniref:hypothetical protein n=1 Tax=Neobacillus sp. PS2-9 TaxID=3070676 RepID=UPI0027E04C92|nr:hypothetical protein [Neobacillus sp. PS2-9]WML58718.1 hypothetical protein RCG25_02680 [Neobacillus sp. PS2-9]
MRLTRYIKNNLIEILNDMKRVPVRLFFSLSVVIIFCFFRTKWLTTEYEKLGIDVRLSVLDGIHIVLVNPVVPIFLSPLFIYLISGLVRVDDEILYTFRYKNRSDIWNIKTMKVVKYAFLFIITLIFIETTIAVFVLSVDNTWMSKGGVLYKAALLDFYHQPHSQLLKNWFSYFNWYHTEMVIGIMIVMNTLGLVIAVYVSMIINEFIANEVWGYIVLFCLGLFETFEDVPILYNHMSIDIVEWLSLSNLFLSFLYLLFLFVIMYVIGRYLTLTKDYLR